MKARLTTILVLLGLLGCSSTKHEYVVVAVRLKPEIPLIEKYQHADVSSVPEGGCVTGRRNCLTRESFDACGGLRGVADRLTRLPEIPSVEPDPTKFVRTAAARLHAGLRACVEPFDLTCGRACFDQPERIRELLHALDLLAIGARDAGTSVPTVSSR